MVSIQSFSNTAVGRQIKKIAPSSVKNEVRQITNAYTSAKQLKGARAGLKAVCKHMGVLGPVGSLILGTVGFFIPIPGAQPIAMTYGYFGGKKAEKGVMNIISKIIKKFPKKG